VPITCRNTPSGGYCQRVRLHGFVEHSSGCRLSDARVDNGMACRRASGAGPQLHAPNGRRGRPARAAWRLWPHRAPRRRVGVSGRPGARGRLLPDARSRPRRNGSRARAGAGRRPRAAGHASAAGRAIAAGRGARPAGPGRGGGLAAGARRACARSAGRAGPGQVLRAAARHCGTRAAGRAAAGRRRRGGRQGAGAAGGAARRVWCAVAQRARSRAQTCCLGLVRGAARDPHSSCRASGRRTQCLSGEHAYVRRGALPYADLSPRL